MGRIVAGNGDGERVFVGALCAVRLGSCLCFLGSHALSIAKQAWHFDRQRQERHNLYIRGSTSGVLGMQAP